MRKLEGWKAVVSVPSQRKAWEVYPLEVYYPDDPTRLCRPKAGQSLVKQNIATGETSSVIAPFHFFGYSNFSYFYH